MSKKIIDRIENLPVPVLPTFVGALTLSNVYGGLGFPLVRHLTSWAATVLLIVYIVKIIKYPTVFKKEYSATVPSSLYAGFTMIMMLLGAYFIQYNGFFGKLLWSLGLFIHTIHVLVFTYRNVFKDFRWDVFVPSWFVTYNGIMVSVVTSGPMNEPLITKILTYYGILIYLLIIPFMIYRLIKIDIKPEFFHTQAILLAPVSLCVVSYLTAIENPNIYLLGILYIALLISLAFVVYMIPSFFSKKFTPAYAGMTFPMAIGIVGSTKMANYLSNVGYVDLSAIVEQISGLQIYLTTTIIGYVLIRFLIMALNKESNN